MLQIIVNHNPNKSKFKILENFEENWVQEEYPVLDDNGDKVIIGGIVTMETVGISAKCAKVPVIKVEVKNGESILIVDSKNKTAPLFTLQGSKALQLTVLENQLTGLLKQYKK